MSTGSGPERLRVVELAKLIVDPSSAKKARLAEPVATSGSVTSKVCATPGGTRGSENVARFSPMRTENCADSWTTDVGLMILPAILVATLLPWPAGRDGKIDDVKAARDRLPSGRGEVDLLEHGRRQLPVDAAHRFLELFEARTERGHLGGQRVARRFGPLQASKKISRGAEPAGREQEDEQSPGEPPNLNAGW